jgi:hypothetical protein
MYKTNKKSKRLACRHKIFINIFRYEESSYLFLKLRPSSSSLLALGLKSSSCCFSTKYDGSTTGGGGRGWCTGNSFPSKLFPHLHAKALCEKYKIQLI